MKWLSVNAAGIISLFSVFLVPANAFSGYMTANTEFDYNTSKTTVEDNAGNSQTSESDDFLQRYFLTLRQDIYPTLSIGAGYVLEKDLRKIETSDTEMRTTFVRMSPSGDITFRNPLFGAAVGYNEIEAKTETRGEPSQTQMQKNFTSNFGLARRENQPTFNIQYSRSHMFDKERLFTDMVNEQVLVGSRYQPLKTVEIKYSGTYSDMVDNLGGVETQNLFQSGRVDYSEGFIQNRLRLYSNYGLAVSQTEVETFGVGGGEVSQTLLPFAGLSGAGPAGTDNPGEAPTNDTMLSNTLLIDGNRNTGSGVNIGFSSLETGARNMGLDLGTPAELNSLFVWVNQRLPASITNAFSWDIYISSDTGDVKQWTLWQTLGPAPFGTFDARFELRFTQVETRFIKVVTRPLASPVPVPGIDVNNIPVTEIQAFIITPSSSIPKSTVRNTSQRIEVGANAKLSDVPNLYYDVYYWQAKSDLQGTSPYLLVNSLSLKQRLNRVFSTGASASRTDNKQGEDYHLRYDYSAFLTAVPLPALNHTLRVTRQTEETDNTTSRSNYVYLNNNAALYRGISANLSIARGEATSDTGQESKITTLTAGSTLVPFRTMTINFYYSKLKSQVTEGDNQGSGHESKSASASVAYTPYPALYLFGSHAIARKSVDHSEEGPTSRTQTYSVSWSPLFSGSLWLTVSATQVITSPNDYEATTITPQIRWVVNSNAILEAGYQVLTIKNYLSKSETDTLFVTLRLAF